MLYLGTVGRGCRLGSLRGQKLFASPQMRSAPFPASDCAFGKCAGECCSHSCRLSLEDIVDIGHFMAEAFRLSGKRRGGFSVNFLGAPDEPGYETLRGFLSGAKKSGGCVFVDPKRKNACMLHSLALKKGLDWRRMKPFTCVLYPARMKYLPDASGIVLMPSREPSICPSLPRKRGAKGSAFLDAKMEDIQELFSLIKKPPSPELLPSKPLT